MEGEVSRVEGEVSRVVEVVVVVVTGEEKKRSHSILLYHSLESVWSQSDGFLRTCWDFNFKVLVFYVFSQVPYDIQDFQEWVLEENIWIYQSMNCVVATTVELE